MVLNEKEKRLDNESLAQEFLNMKKVNQELISRCNILDNENKIHKAISNKKRSKSQKRDQISSYQHTNWHTPKTNYSAFANEEGTTFRLNLNPEFQEDVVRNNQQNHNFFTNSTYQDMSSCLPTNNSTSTKNNQYIHQLDHFEQVPSSEKNEYIFQTDIAESQFFSNEQHEPTSRRNKKYLSNEQVYKYNRSLVEGKILNSNNNKSQHFGTKENMSKTRKKIKSEFKSSLLNQQIKRAKDQSKSRSKSKSKGKKLRQTLIERQKQQLQRLNGGIKNKLTASYKRFIRDLQVSHTMQDGKKIEDLMKENRILSEIIDQTS